MSRFAENLKTLPAVAHLARLGPYPPQAREKLSQEFAKILELFDVLAEMGEEAPPASFGPSTHALRADEVHVFKAHERLVDNFPEREGTLLKIPKVIG